MKTLKTLAIVAAMTATGTASASCWERGTEVDNVGTDYQPRYVEVSTAPKCKGLAMGAAAIYLTDKWLRHHSDSHNFIAKPTSNGAHIEYRWEF